MKFSGLFPRLSRLGRTALAWSNLPYTMLGALLLASLLSRLLLMLS